MGRHSKLNRVLIAASLVLAWGCDNDKEAQGGEEPEIDSGTSAGVDGGADAGQAAEPDGGPSCTAVPDHLQIINAPTETEAVHKEPELPLLNQDGTLPPLP